jgi:molybdate transport system substrate-binding protein
MAMDRRSLLLAAPAVPLVAIGMATPALAETTDLILTCDPTLAAAMAEAAKRFGQMHSVLVNIFPTPPGLILPQIARHIQNDMIITRSSAIQDAVAAGSIAADAPHGGQWRNRLVIAGRTGGPASAATGRLAVTDRTPGSEIDGPALAKTLKLGQGGIAGVIDTDTVAYLLLRGEADAGLLHRTDVLAYPGLAVIAAVPDDVAPPILYSIAVTKLSRRPNPQAFITFLESPDGAAALSAAGLEVVS